MSPSLAEQRRRFAKAYGEHRAAEGHGRLGDRELLSLPYLRHGPIAPAWRVRARTFRHFEDVVVGPLARSRGTLRILDAGAGNAWLSYRMVRRGHRSTALDLRASGGDSLQTGARYAAHLPSMFNRVAADFAELPLGSGQFDIVAFNASLHYAIDLHHVLAEACRVLRPGGRIAVLDSPFYKTAEDGEAMVAEKRRTAPRQFGERHDVLTSLPFIEYLTAERLREASRDLDVEWYRRRVRYTIGYELRPLVAALRRRRAPSRFDLWVGQVASI